MVKAAVVYVTRSGETGKIGGLIAEGMRFEGMEVKVMEAKEVSDPAMLEGYDAVVLGAPTYHGGMLKGMETFLFLLEKAELSGKVGGAFGAFGWSAEAPTRIYDTMEHVLGMAMVGGPLLLKSSSLGGGIGMAQDYGREVARGVVAQKASA